MCPVSVFDPMDVLSSRLQMRPRNWDHYFVVVNIIGKELRVREGKKVWARKSSRGRSCVLEVSGVGNDQEGELDSLQERLQTAVVKQEQVPGSDGDQTDGDRRGNMQESFSWGKNSGNKLGKHDENLISEWTSFPRGKVVQRPAAENFWVGRANEGREEWMREGGSKMLRRKGRDIREVQAVRILDHRRKRDSLVAWKGRKVEVTVDRVFLYKQTSHFTHTRAFFSLRTSVHASCEYTFGSMA